jgi:hypothetical protein
MKKNERNHQGLCRKQLDLLFSRAGDSCAIQSAGFSILTSPSRKMWRQRNFDNDTINQQDYPKKHDRRMQQTAGKQSSRISGNNKFSPECG